MAKFSTTALLDFFVEHIRQTGKTKNMKSAAARHFNCDRKTITRALHDLRRERRLGRDVFRKWRDGL